MTAKGTRTAANAIADSTVVKIAIDTSLSDPTLAMVDTTNGVISILRPGLYFSGGSVAYAAIGATTFAQSRLHKTSTGGTTLAVANIGVVGINQYPSPSVISTDSLVAGDVILLAAFQQTGGSVGITSNESTLFVSEIPTW